MAGHRCLNCDTLLDPSWHFCPSCGQRGDAARLSVRDIRREIGYAFAHAERGLLSFAWALLIRPGLVARDYVQGKRRRYYGPFATLFVLVGVTALAVNAMDYGQPVPDPLPHLHSAFMRQHVNHVLLAQLPVLGLVCAALFRSSGLLWTEHMVMVAYALTVRAAFLAVVVSLAWLTSLAFTADTPSTHSGWVGTSTSGGWRRSSIRAPAFGHGPAGLPLPPSVTASSSCW